MVGSDQMGALQMKNLLCKFSTPTQLESVEHKETVSTSKEVLLMDSERRFTRCEDTGGQQKSISNLVEDCASYLLNDRFYMYW